MENDHGNHLHKSVAVSEAVWQFVELVVPTVMIHLTNLTQFLLTILFLNSYHDFNDHLRTHYQHVIFSSFFVYNRKTYNLFSFKAPLPLLLSIFLAIDPLPNVYMYMYMNTSYN